MREYALGPKAVPVRRVRRTVALISSRPSAGAFYELALQEAVLCGGTRNRHMRFPGSLRGKNRSRQGGRCVPGEVDSAPAHTSRRCPQMHGESRSLAHVLALEDCDHNSYHHIDICRGPYYYFASGGGELCQ